ncbi:hypothetical protein SESBI_30126 [Sesbania bispinosa]|nr:hypothetical protein SESBI_30126 [Sesbania bispinosa]
MKLFEMDDKRKTQRTSASRGRTSTSMSSASSSQSRARTCNCGDELLLLTSKTASNPGRVLAEEEVLQEEGKTEAVGFIDHQAAEETMRKNWKLRKKLGTEREKAKYLLWLVVMSWVVTSGVILISLLKCGCID